MNKFKGSSIQNNRSSQKNNRNENTSNNKTNKSQNIINCNLNSNNSVKNSAKLNNQTSKSKEKDNLPNCISIKSNTTKFKRKNSEVILPIINNLTVNPSKMISNLNTLKISNSIENSDNNSTINQQGNSFMKKTITKMRSPQKNSIDFQSNKVKEDYNDRNNSVRKSFIDRKLHIFNKEKTLYVK
jgi:hypothetical protein